MIMLNFPSNASWLHLVEQSLKMSLPEDIVTKTPPAYAVIGLKAVLAAAVAYGINSALNARAMEGLLSKDTWDWTKEIVLITGGSSGMGHIMAKKLAAKKIKVIILDIVPPQVADPNLLFYQTDITQPDAIKKASEQIRKDAGNPTVLINNAGISMGKNLLDCSESQIRRMFEVNSMALFWTTREFLPYMIKKNHGHVVTMASMASFVTIAGNIDYSCSKVASLAFHEGLRQELKHRYNARNVQSSVVHPYWVRTDMTTNLRADPDFKESVIEPEDVAELVVRQVLSGRGRQLIVPWTKGIATIVRAFPEWLQEVVRDSKSGILRNTQF